MNTINSSNLKLLLRRNRISIIIICIFIVFTLFLSFKLNIWEDEYYSLATASRDLGFAFSRALLFENQPPIYFVLLNLWLSICNSVFFARLLSILFILASFFVYRIILRDFFPKVDSSLFLAVLAFNPLTIWAATEIRVYALIMLLTPLLIFYFIKAYVEDNKNSRIIYIIISAAALYTQYYLGFILAINGAALILNKRTTTFRTKYIPDMIIPALSLLLLVPFIPGQISAQIEKTTHLSFLLALKENYVFLVSRIQLYLFSSVPDLMGGKLYWGLRIGFVLFLFLSAKKYINKKWISDFKNNYFIILTLGLIISYLIIFNLFTPDLIKWNHTSDLFLPLILFVSLFIFAGQNKKIVTAWLLFFLLIYAAGNYYNYSPLAKLGDAKRVSAYISKFEKPNETIIAGGTVCFPLKYHYSGENQIVDMKNSLIRVDENHTPEKLKEYIDTTAKSDHFWVALQPDFTCGYNFDKALTNVLEKYYTIERTKTFYLDLKLFLVKKDRSSFGITENNKINPQLVLQHN